MKVNLEFDLSNEEDAADWKIATQASPMMNALAELNNKIHLGFSEISKDEFLEIIEKNGIVFYEGE